MPTVHSATLTGAKFKIVNVSRFNYISAMLTLYCISDSLFHYSNHTNTYAVFWRALI